MDSWQLTLQQDAYRRCVNLQVSLVEEYLDIYLSKKQERKEEDDDEEYYEDFGLSAPEKLKKYLEPSLPDIADVFQSAANVTVPLEGSRVGKLRALMVKRKRELD